MASLLNSSLQLQHLQQTFNQVQEYGDQIFKSNKFNKFLDGSASKIMILTNSSQLEIASRVEDYIYMQMSLHQYPTPSPNIKQIMADPKAVLSQIKARIKETIKQVGKASDVFQLDLSQIKIGKFTPQIKKTIEAYSNIEAITFAECDLTSLQNFPLLKRLQQLDISSNSLTDADLKIVASNCKQLTRLSIGDNQLSKLESLKILKNLPLESLECDDNPLSSNEQYTKTAFQIFKNLKYLDNKDKQGNEMIEDQEMNGEQSGQDGQGDEEQEAGDEDDYEQGQGQEGEEQQEQEQSQSQEKPKKKKK